MIKKNGGGASAKVTKLKSDRQSDPLEVMKSFEVTMGWRFRKHNPGLRSLFGEFRLWAWCQGAVAHHVARDCSPT